MKSTVKHYKYINGKLTFVENEIHEYSRKECPCQPETQVVLSERRSNGRRTVLLAEAPRQRGRPVDELKANVLGNYITEDIERMIGEMQYHGTFNEDDENPLDLLPEDGDDEKEVFE